MLLASDNLALPLYRASLASPAAIAIAVGLLAERGDTHPFADGESLFMSGRLDSMAATNLIISIEAEFGIEVGGADFDVSILDSVKEMSTLVN